MTNQTLFKRVTLLSFSLWSPDGSCVAVGGKANQTIIFFSSRDKMRTKSMHFSSTPFPNVTKWSGWLHYMNLPKRITQAHCHVTPNSIRQYCEYRPIMHPSTTCTTRGSYDD
ncbi:Protein CBG14022 [Caenorhabditis briggsae]|uniref:Protein CBG14022 n=1 Tax=Caenorhabditis briggsae TaxID=6238 RepID=A8XJ75_CAEBR|nr:Protein CBG14022 [Caenorhabditis briggsae]CAP32700.1 Protein CBG14022 [Caenorhabditis briggsae]